MSSSRHTHLTADERKIIESGLNHPDITLKVIARRLGLSDKCIRNEIRNHRQLKIRSSQRNKCGKQKICDKHRLCTHCIQGVCAFCTHENCNQLCSDLVPEPVCPRTSRFPYVCSGCPEPGSCRLPKFFYYAETAHTEYKKNVSVWKTGPHKTDMEMKRICEVVQEGVRKKWSLDVIIHKYNPDVTVTTLYRYIERHYIAGVSNIDLKRKVRYKPRKKPRSSLTPVNYDYLNGQRCKDFLERISNEDPSINVWEMDPVEEKRRQQMRSHPSSQTNKSSAVFPSQREDHA